MGIDYKVEHRNVKYPRLEFKTGNLLLVLPRNYKDEEQLVKKHNRWIYNKNFIIKTGLEIAKNKKLNETRTNEELKRLVHSVSDNFIEEYNFEINDIHFRKMKTKWGSYSSKSNLTVNTLLKYLPKELIEYVIFHELVHSRQKRHNERFWKTISKRFEDWKTKEKDLLAYWFLVQKSMSDN